MQRRRTSVRWLTGLLVALAVVALAVMAIWSDAERGQSSAESLKVVRESARGDDVAQGLPRRPEPLDMGARATQPGLTDLEPGAEAFADAEPRALLPLLAPLELRVVDATGAPQPQAEIFQVFPADLTLQPPLTEVERVLGRSDTGGRLQLPARSLELERNFAGLRLGARKPGFVPARVVVNLPTERVEFVLERVRSVELSVRSALDGSPVADARVEVRNLLQDVDGHFQSDAILEGTRTDAHGLASLHQVGARAVSVDVHAPGFEHWVATLTPPSAEEPSWSAELVPARVVHVLVSDTSGVPLPDLPVELDAARALGADLTARTDSDGRLVLDRVPRDRMGLGLMIRQPPFAGFSGFLPLPPFVPGEEPVQLEIELTRGPALEVLVTGWRAEHGAPIVTLSSGGFMSLRTWARRALPVDEAVRFEALPAATPIDVVLRAPNGEQLASAPGRLPALEGEVERVTFELEPHVSLTVRVNGPPSAVSLGTVSLETLEGLEHETFSSTTRSRSGPLKYVQRCYGEAELLVRPGPYSLRYVASSGLHAEREIDVPPGAPMQVELELGAGLSLAGRLVDRSGAPMADQQLALLEEGSTARATSDADGRFEFSELGTRRGTLYWLSDEGALTELAAVPAEAPTFQDYVAPSCRVRGQVRAPGGLGDPSSVSLRVQLLDPLDPLVGWLSSRVPSKRAPPRHTLDAEGRFELSLPRGVWAILATHDGRAQASARVTVGKPGCPDPVELLLAEDGVLKLWRLPMDPAELSVTLSSLTRPTWEPPAEVLVRDTNGTRITVPLGALHYVARRDGEVVAEGEIDISTGIEVALQLP
ncbi:MAG: hypothetical protein DHS20C15_22650 [Planctomycetota bacterium]|nr:MAG: hypothetical protein DHS20C15_22650 [Planctomycetota bacterium]